MNTKKKTDDLKSNGLNEYAKLLRLKDAAKSIDKLFHKVWDTLENLDIDKLQSYVAKNKKPITKTSDMFGREIHVGDLVVFDWSGKAYPWFGYVTGPSPRNIPNEYFIMETGYIHPENDNPFEESCGGYLDAKKLAVICEYTDIEKTLKQLKKHCDYDKL
jgi:hypothetical protein